MVMSDGMLTPAISVISAVEGLRFTADISQGKGTRQPFLFERPCYAMLCTLEGDKSRALGAYTELPHRPMQLEPTHARHSPEDSCFCHAKPQLFALGPYHLTARLCCPLAGAVLLTTCAILATVFLLQSKGTARVRWAGLQAVVLT